MSDNGTRWPRHDPRDPGVPPREQDRTIHPVPALVLIGAIFRDLASPRDRVYNH